jgi:hypothetical protein
VGREVTCKAASGRWLFLSRLRRMCVASLNLRCEAIPGKDRKWFVAHGHRPVARKLLLRGHKNEHGAQLWLTQLGGGAKQDSWGAEPPPGYGPGHGRDHMLSVPTEARATE